MQISKQKQSNKKFECGLCFDWYNKGAYHILDNNHICVHCADRLKKQIEHA